MSSSDDQDDAERDRTAELGHQVQPGRRFLWHRRGSADCQEPGASIRLRLYEADCLVTQQPGCRLHAAGSRGYRGVWLLLIGELWDRDPQSQWCLPAAQTIRIGVGVGYGVTDLNQDQTIHDRLVLPTGVMTGVRSFSTDGSAHHLLLTAGAQWDLATAFTLGAMVTSAGLRIAGSSKVKFSRILFQSGGAQDDLAFRDSDAKFDFKIPLRAMAGVTFRYSRGQVELDVRYHGAEDEYEMFSSDSTGVEITTDPLGT